MSNVVCDQTAVIQGLINAMLDAEPDGDSAGDPNSAYKREIKQLEYIDKVTKAVERMEKYAEKEYKNVCL